jgi:hypothetical protein
MLRWFWWHIVLFTKLIHCIFKRIILFFWQIKRRIPIYPFRVRFWAYDGCLLLVKYLYHSKHFKVVAVFYAFRTSYLPILLYSNLYICESHSVNMLTGSCFPTHWEVDDALGLCCTHSFIPVFVNSIIASLSRLLITLEFYNGLPVSVIASFFVFNKFYIRHAWCF